VTPAEAPLLSLAPPDREIVERLSRGLPRHGDGGNTALLERAREEGPYVFGSESLGEEPLTFVKRRDGKITRGLLVRTSLGPAAYENTCPHVPIPLDRDGESLLSEDGRHLVCNNHGALFERETGLCVSGPCAGERLRPIPIAPEGEGVRLLP
jgi:nitrite reductase/ring-hydroxylating ferredoxin subunit